MRDLSPSVDTMAILANCNRRAMVWGLHLPEILCLWAIERADLVGHDINDLASWIEGIIGQALIMRSA